MFAALDGTSWVLQQFAERAAVGDAVDLAGGAVLAATLLTGIALAAPDLRADTFRFDWPTPVSVVVRADQILPSGSLG